MTPEPEAAAPIEEPPKVDPKIQAIKPEVDPNVIATRDTLMGASTMGFVNCVVIGMKARGEGVQVLGTGGLDVMQSIGALEVAKVDLMGFLRRGPGRG